MVNPTPFASTPLQLEPCWMQEPCATALCSAAVREAPGGLPAGVRRRL